MSNDDVSSGQPGDKNQRVDRPMPVPDPWRRSGGNFFRKINGAEDGESTVGSPAVRLAAWIAGIVLVLMILGWALEGAY